MKHIEIANLYKSYRKGSNSIPVLKGISLQVNKGDFVALLGKSGSGKSSLLNIIGLLDHYDKGEYLLNQKEISFDSETQLSKLRNENIGFIFQSYNLLPFKNAAENVALPLYYRGVSYKKRMAAAEKILGLLEISERAKHYPSELSGGESQRVAIGRAIAGNPGLVLADEPTGALDSATGDTIMSVFETLNKQGITIIMVTHDEAVASRATSIYHIRDGQISN